MHDYPLVSVLMTSYNREKFIKEAIESVLGCGYPNFELVIVDDASVDQTVEIAKSAAQKDCRVSVYQNPVNLGDYPNRNRAASLAKGKYIVYTDSDDTMFTGSLLKWVEAIEAEKVKFGIFVSDTFNEPTVLESEKAIRHHYFQKPLLMYGPGATIIERDYFRKIGGFPAKYGPANDMYFNQKAASQTATLFLPFPVCDYRIHEAQERNNQYGYLFNQYLYLKDALVELPLGLSQSEKNYLSRGNKRRFILNWIRFLMQSADIPKSIAAIRKAKFGLFDLWQAL